MNTIRLDITREHCPMTFVKTKLALEKISKGDCLEVLLTRGEPLDNVPKTAAEQGYIVKSIDNVENDIFRVIIEK